jgi:hypothetical protein
LRARRGLAATQPICPCWFLAPREKGRSLPTNTAAPVSISISLRPPKLREINKSHASHAGLPTALLLAKSESQLDLLLDARQMTGRCARPKLPVTNSNSHITHAPIDQCRLVSDVVDWRGKYWHTTSPHTSHRRSRNFDTSPSCAESGISKRTTIGEIAIHPIQLHSKFPPPRLVPEDSLERCSSTINLRWRDSRPSPTIRYLSAVLLASPVEPGA